MIFPHFSFSQMRDSSVIEEMVRTIQKKRPDVSLQVIGITWDFKVTTNNYVFQGNFPETKEFLKWFIHGSNIEWYNVRIENIDERLQSFEEICNDRRTRFSWPQGEKYWFYAHLNGYFVGKTGKPYH